MSPYSQFLFHFPFLSRNPYYIGYHNIMQRKISYIKYLIWTPKCILRPGIDITPSFDYNRIMFKTCGHLVIEKKQSHYSGFQEVKVPRFRDKGTGWW